MQKKFYDALSEPFETNKALRRCMIAANRILTFAFYAIYPVMAIVLLVLGDPRFWKVLLVPALSFLLVTLFRRLCSARRPYEVWDEKPLIPKETAGRSFPSRHVFSAFMIAMAMLWLCVPAGIVLMVAGAFLALIRVIGKVHFVRDVVAGALIAVGLGILGFWVIPPF